MQIVAGWDGLLYLGGQPPPYRTVPALRVTPAPPTIPCDLMPATPPKHPGSRVGRRATPRAKGAASEALQQAAGAMSARDIIRTLVATPQPTAVIPAAAPLMTAAPINDGIAAEVMSAVSASKQSQQQQQQQQLQLFAAGAQHCASIAGGIKLLGGRPPGPPPGPPPPLRRRCASDVR